MCIRDRTQTATVGAFVMALAVVAVILSTCGGPEPMPMPNPVSYTHLRAHETVLDLVCRLLLEKKKKELRIYDMRASNTAILDNPN